MFAFYREEKLSVECNTFNTNGMYFHIRTEKNIVLNSVILQVLIIAIHAQKQNILLIISH